MTRVPRGRVFPQSECAFLGPCESHPYEPPSRVAQLMSRIPQTDSHAPINSVGAAVAVINRHATGVCRIFRPMTYDRKMEGAAWHRWQKQKRRSEVSVYATGCRNSARHRTRRQTMQTTLHANAILLAPGGIRVDVTTRTATEFSPSQHTTPALEFH